MVHPGAMGASVGAALVGAGHAVWWVREGRSAATAARAKRAGLEAAEDLTALVGRVEAVVSVCPPEAAETLAQSVMQAGFRGTFVDANAVSPATARAIGSIVRDAGGHFVDGGIVGPPAWRAGSTRLYLSGPDAPEVARWFDGGALDAIAIGDDPGAASALKMCYASYTKGTSALLLAIRALAAHEGVNDALIAEWNRSQPGLPARSEGAATGSAPKAWRFAGEMHEIARSFEEAGLPGGFFHGASELYERLAEFKDRDGVRLEEVVSRLLEKE